ncbi:hypothetical protein Btru_070532 [Bulinus truncatus]|nr:hypothetical protein Btru_070532 [Bulinus truncatus]
MTKGEVGGHAEVAKNCESELTSEGLDVIDGTDHVSTSQSDTFSVANPENCSKADRAGVDPELNQSDGQITSENALPISYEELSRGSFGSQDDGDQDGSDSHGGGSNASGSHMNGVVGSVSKEVHSNLQAHQYNGENPTVHALMRKKKQPPSCTLKHFPSKTVVFNCSGHWLNGSKLPRKSLPCKYRQNKQMPISPDVLNRTSLKGRLKNDKPIWNSLSDGERRKLGIYAYPPTISNFASHPGSHERVRTHGQLKQQNNYRQTQAGRDSNSSRERCNSGSFSSSFGGKSQRNKDNGDNGDENNKDEKSRDFCSVKEDLYLRCRICGVKFECLEESQEHAVKEHSGRIKTQSEFSNPKFYRHFKRSNYKGSQQRFCAERTSSFSEYIETGRFSSNIYEKVTVGPTQIVLVRPTKPVVKNSPDWPHHSLSKTRRAKNLIKCSPPLDLESANIDEVIDVSCSQLLTDETSGILGLEFKQEVKCQISCKVSQLKKKSLTDQKLYTAESEKDDKTFVSQPDAINDQGINSAYAAMTTVGKFEVHCNSGQTGVDGDTVVAGVLAIKTEPLSDSEEESLPVTFDEACLLKRNTLSGGQTSSESCSLLDAGCHSPTQANQTYQISRKVTPSISVNTRSNADVHSVVLNSSANLVQNHLHKVPEIVVVYPDKPVINLLPRKQLNRNRVARRKKDSHQKAEEVHHCPQQCETIQRSPSPRKEDLSLSYPPLKIDPAFSPQEEEISPSHAEVRDQHSPSLKLDTFPLEEENMNALHVKEKIQQSPLPILRIDTTFSLHEENASASHCQADKSLNNPTLVYVYPKRPVINFSGRAPKSASVQVNLAPSL